MSDQNLLDSIDLSALLRKACAQAGSQTAFAEAVGVTPQHINMVLNARITPSEKVLTALGLRKLVRYAVTPGHRITVVGRARHPTKPTHPVTLGKHDDLIRAICMNSRSRTAAAIAAASQIDCGMSTVLQRINAMEQKAPNA